MSISVTLPHFSAWTWLTPTMLSDRMSQSICFNHSTFVPENWKAVLGRNHCCMLERCCMNCITGKGNCCKSVQSCSAIAWDGEAKHLCDVCAMGLLLQDPCAAPVFIYANNARWSVIRVFRGINVFSSTLSPRKPCSGQILMAKTSCGRMARFQMSYVQISCKSHVLQNFVGNCSMVQTSCCRKA